MLAPWRSRQRRQCRRRTPATGGPQPGGLLGRPSALVALAADPPRSDDNRQPAISRQRHVLYRCIETRQRDRPSRPGFLCVGIEVRDRVSFRVIKKRKCAMPYSTEALKGIDVKKTLFYVFYSWHVFYVFNVFFILPTFFIFKNVRWKYHLKSLSKERKQIGSVWLFFFVPMLEFPYRPIYWQALLLTYSICTPLQNPKYASDVNMPSQTKWRNVGRKNINVFYSTFTNVFYFCQVFLTFCNVFYFFLERFLHLCWRVLISLLKAVSP